MKICPKNQPVIRRSLSVVLPLLVAWLAGCASPNASPADPANRSGSPTTTLSAGAGLPAHAHSECLVCKKNADLACVDVEVDKDTPSYVYNGKAYYFCSDECRDKFARNPQKYAGLAR